MTNKNKNINELVSDDEDPTAELEIVTFSQEIAKEMERSSLEADAHTHDFDGAALDANGMPSLEDLKSDLESRSETIERLQFDVEQLRARWLGLETEIKAREELTEKLNAELESSREKLARRDKMLQKRDRSIKSLKSEIRERDKAFRDLQDTVEQLRIAREKQEKSNQFEQAQGQVEILIGKLASAEALSRELKTKQSKTEEYADDLRRQLKDFTITSDRVFADRDAFSDALADANQQVQHLGRALDEANVIIDETTAALINAEGTHAEEIRLLRFELGEAEDTIVQNEHISEQLASDLVDTRGFRHELERMLGVTEEESRTTIEKLDRKVSKLKKRVSEQEEDVATKSGAINCLLNELAKKSQEIESIGELENVIHEIDDRMSERIEDRPKAERERVTRLLIGRIDDQELRFPLFKDRLTIGRTQQNDIQLKAQHISRRHAVITTEGDAARVIDWGSKNGVYVNSKRVTEHFLKNGDIVTIGIAEFRYEELPKREN
jgi:chromosome segregation ATPase